MSHDGTVESPVGVAAAYPNRVPSPLGFFEPTRRVTLVWRWRCQKGRGYCRFIPGLSGQSPDAVSERPRGRFCPVPSAVSLCVHR